MGHARTQQEKQAGREGCRYPANLEVHFVCSFNCERPLRFAARIASHWSIELSYTVVSIVAFSHLTIRTDLSEIRSDCPAGKRSPRPQRRSGVSAWCQCRFGL